MTSKMMRTICAAVVAVALLLATSSCSLTGGKSMTVTAYLSDSAGLFVGNDVGVLGVPVGKITSIKPVGRQVAVTMQVDTDQPVPADAHALVIARSVATDRYVELSPVYRSGPRMTDGTVIPMSRTETPVDFDQVLSSLNRFATGIGGSKNATQAIKRFIDAGTKALNGRGPLLNQTIHSLADGTNGLAAQRGNVSATLTALDKLVGTIANNQGTAKRFIQQVTRASSILSDERFNFRTMLRSLTKAVRTVARFAVDNRAQIVKTLGGSTKLMRTVLSRQGNLEEILRVLPLALQNLQLARDKTGTRLPVRIDPLVLDPLGGILQNLCNQLPANLCSILDGTDPGANK
ncbi:MAG: MCE family protein [Nocardioidaceae bacterium]|nr:MCE family protein [Nocardioidaceae bacterium]MCL2611789.1 MCE family protein [Nocardioidaceae bacterium]